MRYIVTCFFHTMGIMVVTFGTIPAFAQEKFDVCLKFIESVFIPPSYEDVERCALDSKSFVEKAVICANPIHPLIQCCGPTCRAHPECVIVDRVRREGFTTDELCRELTAEEIFEIILSGRLAHFDNLVAPGIMAALDAHVSALKKSARRIPRPVRDLIEVIMNAPLANGLPRFSSSHVNSARILPVRTATAGLYLGTFNPNDDAITLGDLIILQNNLYDTLMTIRDMPLRLLHTRNFPQFEDAISILMHELVHVREWDDRGVDRFANEYLVKLVEGRRRDHPMERDGYRLQDNIFAGLRRGEFGDIGWMFSYRPPSVAGVPGVSEQISPSSGPIGHAAPAGQVSGISPGDVFGVYQYNSSGRPIRLRRLDVGRYEVVFEGLNGMAGVALASAYGENATWCGLEDFGGAGNDARVVVNCFAPGGQAADSSFTALFHDEDQAGVSTAYVVNRRPNEVSHEPPPSMNWNPSRIPNRIERQGVGRYLVTVPETLQRSATALVSALGSSGGRCQVRFLLPAGRETHVAVLCFEPAGNPVDQAFALIVATTTYPGA